MVIVEND
jgi:chromosome segregation ATPase